MYISLVLSLISCGISPTAEPSTPNIVPITRTSKKSVATNITLSGYYLQYVYKYYDYPAQTYQPTSRPETEPAKIYTSTTPFTGEISLKMLDASAKQYINKKLLPIKGSASVNNIAAIITGQNTKFALGRNQADATLKTWYVSSMSEEHFKDSTFAVSDSVYKSELSDTLKPKFISIQNGGATLLYDTNFVDTAKLGISMKKLGISHHKYVPYNYYFFDDGTYWKYSIKYTPRWSSGFWYMDKDAQTIALDLGTAGAIVWHIVEYVSDKSIMRVGVCDGKVYYTFLWKSYNF
ncbi:MAG: hypothetical protein NW207_00745 [Cytophagales bacterium]|nr:hypothetical protein [Cytophagales bacterium]